MSKKINALNPVTATFMQKIAERLKTARYGYHAFHNYDMLNPDFNDKPFSYLTVLGNIIAAGGTERRMNIFPKKMVKNIFTGKFENANRGSGVHSLMLLMSIGFIVRGKNGYSITEDGQFYFDHVVPELKKLAA